MRVGLGLCDCPPKAGIGTTVVTDESFGQLQRSLYLSVRNFIACRFGRIAGYYLFRFSLS